jgi:4-hydroxybenzoate polyprenyltransferase
LASGTLPTSWAIVAMILLVLICTVLTLLIFTIPADPLPHNFAAGSDPNILFVLAVCSFLLLTIFYTLRLKHIVLLDVFTTSATALLRVLAGAVVIPLAVSPWLSLLSILLVIFFGLGKRRHELGLLQQQASLQRQVLKEYSIPLLDQAMTILIATIITVYGLYTLLGSGGNQLLVATVPLVLYGMLRYLYRVYMRKESAIPEAVLFSDRHLFITVVLCVAIIVVTRYGLL